MKNMPINLCDNVDVLNHSPGLFFFPFWVTSGDAQGLLLALHSGITPGSAQGTIWDAGI